MQDVVSQRTTAATPREALRTLGVGRFAPALLIAGLVNVAGTDFLDTQLRYIGLPKRCIACGSGRLPPSCSPSRISLVPIDTLIEAEADRNVDLQND
jgi:hypothetical protein